MAINFNYLLIIMVIGSPCTGEIFRHRRGEGSVPPLQDGNSTTPNTEGRIRVGDGQGLPLLRGAQAIMNSGSQGKLPSTKDPVGLPKSCETRHAVSDYAAIPVPKIPQGAADGGIFFLADLKDATAQVYYLKSPSQWPIAITKSQVSIRDYRTSPAGDRLLVVPENQSPYIVSYPKPKRSLAQKTWPNNAKLTSYVWSPKGDRLYVLASESKKKELTLMEWKLGFPPKKISDLQGWKQIEDISPDEKQLLIRHQHGEAHHSLAIWDIKKNTLKELPIGRKPSWISKALFSGDSKGVFYLGDRGKTQRQLLYFPLTAESQPRILTPPNTDIDAFQLNHDRSVLVYRENRAGYTQIGMRQLDAAGRIRRSLTVPNKRPGVIDYLQFRTQTKPSLLYTFSASRFPDNIWDWSSPQNQQWTQASTSNIRSRCFADETMVQFPSFDKTMITGFLYGKKPGPGPFVVLVPDGPQSQFRPKFQPVIQYLIERQIGVLVPLIRGSHGLGRQLANLDNHPKRGNTARDIIAAGNYLIQNRLAKPEVLGVIGYGHGGAISLNALTLKESPFGVGGLVVPEFDLAPRRESLPLAGLSIFENEFGKITTGFPNISETSGMEKIPPLMVFISPKRTKQYRKIMNALEKGLKATKTPFEKRVLSSKTPWKTIDSLMRQVQATAYFFKGIWKQRKKAPN